MRVCCEIPESAVDDHWGPPRIVHLGCDDLLGLDWVVGILQGKNLRAWSVHAPAAAGSGVGGKVMGQQGALDAWASMASTGGDGEQAGPRGRSPFPFFFFFLRFSEFVTILFVFYVLVFWLGDMWDLSFSTRDQACTRWFGRQSLNPWAAKGVYFL